MSELLCLELSILLWVAHIATQGFFANAAVGSQYLTSARDDAVKPSGVEYPRATRALGNYLENFAPLIAADLGLIATNHTGGWGATIWIIARIVYLPLYVMGVPNIRSAAWAISVVGLLMMLARLAGV